MWLRIIKFAVRKYLVNNIMSDKKRGPSESEIEEGRSSLLSLSSPNAKPADIRRVSNKCHC